MGVSAGVILLLGLAIGGFIWRKNQKKKVAPVGGESIQYPTSQQVKVNAEATLNSVEHPELEGQSGIRYTELEGRPRLRYAELEGNPAAK